ncbi:MAG: HNH endonuclease [Acidobacteria bacterium]|nr:HNH endonuclease [Acidobacteriota bacterium]
MRPTEREIRFVRERAEDYCEYCLLHQRHSLLRFHVDHIVPRSVGGIPEFSNLALACPACNGAKHGKWLIYDRGSRTEVKLYHPRTDVWDDHFETRDFGIILPRTLTGSVTVHMLKINDYARMQLRKLAARIERR